MKKPKLFEEMDFKEKMKHLEECRLNAIECIRVGEPSMLADIADWPEYWGLWLMDEVKRLKEFEYKYEGLCK